MLSFCRLFVSALMVTPALGGSAPAAIASTTPAPHFAAPPGFPVGGGAATLRGAAAGDGGICGAPSASQGNGASVAGTAAQVCLAPGSLSFVGPAIGQVSSIVGPTIIGPTVGVSVIQSAGSVGGG